MEAKTVLDIQLDKAFQFTLSGVDFISFYRALDLTPYEIANEIHAILIRDTFNGENKISIDGNKTYTFTLKGFQFLEVNNAIRRIEYKDAKPLLASFDQQITQQTSQAKELDNSPANNEKLPENPFTNAAREQNIPG